MTTTLTCSQCGTALERVRYFPRQLLTADDMRAEQEWARAKLQRHNRFLHGWGVVCGLAVEAPVATDPPWQVTICPGYAVTPHGDEVNIDEPIRLDLRLGSVDPEPCGDVWPCPPRGVMPGKDRAIVFIAVRYAECTTRPVTVHPPGCGCDEAGCDYSRIRDSFELKVLWELPESHTLAAAQDQRWRALVSGELSLSPTTRAAAPSRGRRAPAGEAVDRRHPIPVPPCRPCFDDPWVVLAAARLPDNASTYIVDGDISYAPRRVLWSVGDLMAAIGI